MYINTFFAYQYANYNTKRKNLRNNPKTNKGQNNEENRNPSTNGTKTISSKQKRL